MLTLVLPLLLTAPQYVPRVEKAPAGRYLGFKQVGADPYAYQSLELIIDAKGGATLIWASRDQSGEKEKRALALTDLKLDQAGFSVTLKGERPAAVPARLVGRFVTKAPPDNAKGRMTPGILFQSDWFLELMHEDRD